jgi:hypothetical protein
MHLERMVWALMMKKKKKKVHHPQRLSGHLPSKLKDESVSAYIYANK